MAVTLTVAGRPLFVDGGTGCYTIDAETRDRFRSSRLHNTVVVGGRSQSIPDGPFHWAHAAQGRRVRWASGRAFDYVEGTHDGYAPIAHHRAVFARAGCWIVRDRLAGAGTIDAELLWHLDPRWTVAPDGSWMVATDGAGPPLWVATVEGAFEAIAAGAGAPDTADLGWVAPAYGRFERTTTLRRRVSAAAPADIVTVIVESQTRPEIERLPVQDGPSRIDGSAVRLRSARGVDTVVFCSAADRDPTAVAGLCRAIDLDTDAAFAWHHAPGAGGPASAAIVDGRSLRINGLTLIERPQRAAVAEVAP